MIGEGLLEWGADDVEGAVEVAEGGDDAVDLVLAAVDRGVVVHGAEIAGITAAGIGEEIDAGEGEVLRGEAHGEADEVGAAAGQRLGRGLVRQGGEIGKAEAIERLQRGPAEIPQGEDAPMERVIDDEAEAGQVLDGVWIADEDEVRPIVEWLVLPSPVDAEQEVVGGVGDGRVFGGRAVSEDEDRAGSAELLAESLPGPGLRAMLDAREPMAGLDAGQPAEALRDLPRLPPTSAGLRGTKERGDGPRLREGGAPCRLQPGEDLSATDSPACGRNAEVIEQFLVAGPVEHASEAPPDPWWVTGGRVEPEPATQCRGDGRVEIRRVRNPDGTGGLGEEGELAWNIGPKEIAFPRCLPGRGSAPEADAVGEGWRCGIRPGWFQDEPGPGLEPTEGEPPFEDLLEAVAGDEGCGQDGRGFGPSEDGSEEVGTPEGREGFGVTERAGGCGARTGPGADRDARGTEGFRKACADLDDEPGLERGGQAAAQEPSRGGQWQDSVVRVADEGPVEVGDGTGEDLEPVGRVVMTEELEKGFRGEEGGAVAGDDPDGTMGALEGEGPGVGLPPQLFDEGVGARTRPGNDGCRWHQRRTASPGVGRSGRVRWQVFHGGSRRAGDGSWTRMPGGSLHPVDTPGSGTWEDEPMNWRRWPVVLALVAGVLLAEDSESGPPVDGAYVLKVTHRARIRPEAVGLRPIPAGDYEAVKEGGVIEVRIRDGGKAVSLLPRKISGVRIPGTNAVQEYELREGLFAGGRLDLEKVGAGWVGTFTEYGSGRPILGSVRGPLELKAAEGR